MKISMIAAMDRNRVIGSAEGGIPWDLPQDVLHFRSYTAGKHLLLGRKTFEEMRGWFSDQQPIVLTHFSRSGNLGVRTAHSVEEAVTEAFEDGATELVVVGGASTYAAALPYADELILSLVDTEVSKEGFEALPRFPEFEEEIEWETCSEESHPTDETHQVAFRVVNLRRISPSSLRPSRLHLG